MKILRPPPGKRLPFVSGLKTEDQGPLTIVSYIDDDALGGVCMTPGLSYKDASYYVLLTYLEIEIAYQVRDDPKFFERYELAGARDAIVITCKRSGGSLGPFADDFKAAAALRKLINKNREKYRLWSR
jgi:hypothetical protein